MTKKLTFGALSDDGTKIVLKDEKGNEFALDLDEKTRDAARNWRKRPKASIYDRNHELSVAEIQARIRAGIASEDLANVSSIPLERIKRFEPPVLQERYWISKRARETEIRKTHGSAAFDEIVQTRILHGGGDIESTKWDAWKREDGRWNIACSFVGRKGETEAHWAYDPDVSTIAPLDDVARWLLDVTPDMPQNQTVEHVIPKLVSVPTIVEEVVEELPKWVTPEGVKEDVANTVPIPKPEPVIPRTVIPKPAPVIPTPEPVVNVVEPEFTPEIIDEPIAVNDSPKPTKSKRASVPSWDEILFGSKGGQ
ncbi:MAG: septation protein SepH [Actinomycetota bacterium]|nr:septation protein SepH [Actinomycetota bacterium]MDA3026818.1 septation protein SepH [Actinomycetota bacterium]